MKESTTRFASDRNEEYGTIGRDYETKRKEMKEEHKVQDGGVEAHLDRRALWVQRVTAAVVEVREKRQLDDWSLMYKMKSEEVNPYKRCPIQTANWTRYLPR